MNSLAATLLLVSFASNTCVNSNDAVFVTLRHSMLGITLVVACLCRGGMLTALLVLFVLMGSFAGYWSATMYKFFNGKMWKRSTLATALLFPTINFLIFWAIDLLVRRLKGIQTA